MAGHVMTRTALVCEDDGGGGVQDDFDRRRSTGLLESQSESCKVENRLAACVAFAFVVRSIGRIDAQLLSHVPAVV